MPPLIDERGNRYGRLLVVRRADRRGNEAYWECRCDCGNLVTVVAGALRNGYTRSCGCLNNEKRSERARATGPQALNWKDGRGRYAHIHARLRKEKGAATNYNCVDCGRSADSWSYDHSDPDQIYSSEGCPFSLDFARYQPRCHSCHNTMDQARAKEKTNA